MSLEIKLRLGYELLKQRTGSLLKEPRNTVLGWVADRGNELVEEEIKTISRPPLSSFPKD